MNDLPFPLHRGKQDSRAGRRRRQRHQTQGRPTTESAPRRTAPRRSATPALHSTHVIPAKNNYLINCLNESRGSTDNMISTENNFDEWTTSSVFYVSILSSASEVPTYLSWLQNLAIKSVLSALHFNKFRVQLRLSLNKTLAYEIKFD